MQPVTVRRGPGPDSSHSTEHRDCEVRIRSERAKVPGREAVFEVQSSRGGMPVEIGERVTAIEAESDNNDPVRPNMISDSS